MYRLSSGGIVIGICVGILLLLFIWFVDIFVGRKLLKSIAVRIGLVVITTFVSGWLAIDWGCYIREGNYSNRKCKVYVGSWNYCDTPASCCVHITGLGNQYYCKEHSEDAQEWYDRCIDMITRIDSDSDSDSDSNSGSGSSSGKSATCKVCGRSFNAGDSAGNFMSIARSGMCNNCHRNFMSMNGE